MLKLPSVQHEPFTLDATALGDGVVFRVRPVSVAMILAARRAVSDALAADKNLSAEEKQVLFGSSVVRAGLIGWDGIGDKDGNAVPVSDDAVDALLGNWRIFLWFEQNYVAPSFVKADEKNG